MTKKRIAIVMALVLAVQMLPLPAGAMEGVFDIVSQSRAAGALSGTDGNIHWELTAEDSRDGWLLGSETPYKLTLTGTGGMLVYGGENYTNGGKTVQRTTAPWKEYFDHIQTISIGSGITNVSAYAFYGCSSALSVEIPDSVRSIGTYAFRKCSALKSVTLPKGVQSIERYAFADCTDAASIDLPDSVTSIGEFAFASCTSLKEFTVPGKVKTIGDAAFSSCVNLEKVHISEGVEVIGGNAFQGCRFLTQIDLPENSLTTLQDYCFCDTERLTSFQVPASVTSIGLNPFICPDYYSMLREVTVEPGNKNYAAINNMLVELQNSVPYKVISYPRRGDVNARVPDSVKIIGECAFYGTLIQSVDLPGSLLTIERQAFYNNTYLKEIDVPGNVTEIQSSAFYGCTVLEDVALGGDLLSIGEYAFYNCKKLSAIDLPDKVTSIGSCAFYNCTGLREVVFPNSITTMGVRVLANCSSLEKVSFGQHIQAISGNVFEGCPKLAEISISPRNPYMLSEENVVYDKDKTTLIYYAASKADDRFSIPDAVTTVGAYAFTYCAKLEELRFPDSVSKLGDHAVFHNETLGKLLFYGDAPSVVEKCSEETRDNITYHTPQNISVYQNKVKNGDYDNSGVVIFRTQSSTGWEDGWTQTKEYQYHGTESTRTWEQKYILQEWDPARTDEAEGTCDGLKWKYRDDIGELVFSGSGKIPDFTLDTLPTWNEAGEDSHMQDIRLIETGPATEVGNYAFYGAEKLLRILSGDELERVGEQSLADCTSLKIVQVQSAAEIEKEAFMGDTAIQDELDVRGAKVIGEGAFRGCAAMTDILLGESLKTLEGEAFQACKALETLILPESLTSIGDGCFSGCETLRSLNIPKGVSAVPENCFKNCKKFQKVYFYGDCPAAWADNAFQGTHAELTIYYRKGNATWSRLGGSWNGIPVVGLDKFYTEQRDHYSFANTRPSFGYSSNYLIPRQRFVTALQSIVRGSYYYAWASVWEGSCFGMAASTTEFYQGEQFDVRDFSPTTKTLYDVKAPGNSSADLTKLIEIYHVSQCVDEVGWENAQNMEKYRKLIKQVEEFERSGGLEVDSTADPVVMCVYSENSGHAVVPVSVNMDGEGNYIMDVYDGNYPDGLQKLTIKKDFSGIEYGKYKSASFVKYSTIRDALTDADFTGESLKKESGESNKVSIAVNREEVSLTNGGGRDFEEIKGAYEQKMMSDDAEDEFGGIRSFVLPQGEYVVQDESEEGSQQEELKYYVATEDLFSKIETSDADAKLTVKSVKGTGYDTVTLSSKNSDTESELTVMDVSGIEKEIAVKGSEISVEMVNDSEMKLTVSEDTTSVEVDGEEIDLSENQANISFYYSPGDNPMEMKDMLCEFSLDDDDRLSGKAEAYVTWTKEDAQDVDVTTKVKDEEGNVIAEYEKKMNLRLGMQKVNVTLNNVKTNLKHISGDFEAVCEMTLVDADDNVAQATYSGIALKAAEKDTEQPPINTEKPSSTQEPDGTPSPTLDPDGTLSPTLEPDGTPSPTPDPAGTSSPAPDPTQKPPAEKEKPEATKKPGSGKKSSLPKKGKIKTVGALQYIVLKSAKKNGTVAVCGAKKRNAKSVAIPKKVKIGGYSFKVVSIYKNAFSKNSKLSKVTIGANVATIGDSAFKNCKKLEFIIIPKKVTTIGKKAFAGCTGLHYMLVKSNKIKSVGAKAFQGIDSKMTVKTSKNKWRKYAQMFMNIGKMSQNALFIIEPVKLKYKGKSY